MRLYVASSWSNSYQPATVRTLRAFGHEVYDFRNPHLGPGARGRGFQWDAVDPLWEHWTPQQFRAALEHPIARDGFESDRTGMDWSDGTVLVLPSGRSSHLELGYAIGSGKPAWILAPLGEPCVPELMYGLATGVCTSSLELLVALDAHAQRTRAGGHEQCDS